MGALALTPQADARWSRPLPVLMRLVPRLARPSPQLAYLASAHLPRLLGRKRCGGLVDAAALRAAAAAATVAAARRWASHVRAAAAAPLPPLRGDGQAHLSRVVKKSVGSVLVVFFSVAAGFPVYRGIIFSLTTLNFVLVGVPRRNTIWTRQKFGPVLTFC